MSISDKILRLNEIKTDIKNAIISKGQSVENDMTKYATAIRNIDGGGGGYEYNNYTFKLKTSIPGIDVNIGDNVKPIFYLKDSYPDSGIFTFKTKNHDDFAYLLSAPYTSAPFTMYDMSNVNFYIYASEAIGGSESGSYGIVGGLINPSTNYYADINLNWSGYYCSFSGFSGKYILAFGDLTTSRLRYRFIPIIEV